MKDLLNCTEQEILDEIKDQGIIEVKRIKTKRDGALIDTANHILTFNSPKCPNKVKIAFYNLKVRPYIPSPLRCFRCQLFGHTAIRCTKEQICVCGKSIHTGKPCETPITCINCEGQHAVTSKECPVYKQETAIQEIKVKENLTYYEAKKKVIIITPKANISYAKASTPRGFSSSPSINTQELVKELIPVLVNALKDILMPNLSLPSYQNIPLPISPKRGRHGSSDLDTLTSESTSQLNIEVVKRKKKTNRGRGRPRKSTQDPAQDDSSSKGDDEMQNATQ
ncbi:unnamed protein product [Psylliodes chrysocephalus]|uniref:Nucleic-acid-binding protein from mobile element jockey n=1 Tax=Psylliodes chrysocephalus TaxID=3402493 RepID=A0A9P0CMC6_9CUCU|nr:unnamed protein product [Psylliodes chrysocephala]